MFYIFMFVNFMSVNFMSVILSAPSLTNSGNFNSQSPTTLTYVHTLNPTTDVRKRPHTHVASW